MVILNYDGASMSENQEEFREYFIRIVMRGSMIPALSDAITDKMDPNVREACYSQCILMMREFIGAYKKIKEHVPENKKDMFGVFNPYFSMLLEYESGIIEYRNNRIAHMNRFDISSRKLFIEEKLPNTRHEFRVICRIIYKLTQFVEYLFIEKIQENFERMKKQAIDNSKPLDKRDVDKKLVDVKNEILSKIRECESKFSPRLLTAVKALVQTN